MNINIYIDIPAQLPSRSVAEECKVRVCDCATVCVSLTALPGCLAYLVDLGTIVSLLFIALIGRVMLNMLNN